MVDGKVGANTGFARLSPAEVTGRALRQFSCYSDLVALPVPAADDPYR
jgi:hypothetical protein